MDTKDKYTAAVVECLRTMTVKSRESVLAEWKEKVFPGSREIERYLLVIYDKCK